MAVTVYNTSLVAEIQIVYNTGCRRPSGGWFFTAHTVHDSQASLSHQANDRRSVIDFSIFVIGGLTTGPKVTKSGDCLPSTILQNFSPIAQTMFEICVTKLFQSLALIFDPSRSSKVKSDGPNRKPVGPTNKCYRDPSSYLSPFSRHFESKFWLFTFWPWTG